MLKVSKATERRGCTWPNLPCSGWSGLFLLPELDLIDARLAQHDELTAVVEFHREVQACPSCGAFELHRSTTSTSDGTPSATCPWPAHHPYRDNPPGSGRLATTIRGARHAGLAPKLNGQPFYAKSGVPRLGVLPGHVVG